MKKKVKVEKKKEEEFRFNPAIVYTNGAIVGLSWAMGLKSSGFQLSFFLIGTLALVNIYTYYVALDKEKVKKNARRN